jgi:hypothetical protein
MNFDLISDLYIDHWSQDINWDGLGTSLLAVVAGDVSADVDRVVWELKKISSAYKQTIYIEGDLEHSETGWPSNEVHTYLKNKISKIPNCIYLHDNVVVFNDLGFIGANLWWMPIINANQDWESFGMRLRGHKIDIEYLKASVGRMQRANDVNNLCLISHTVPNLELISNYEDQFETGSHASEQVLAADHKNKVKTWCFGHSPQAVDYTVAEVRYISNPRGTPETAERAVYFPLRVEI